MGFAGMLSVGEQIITLIIAILVIAINLYVGYLVVGWLKGER